MVALCLYVIAITGPRPDGVALSSGRMQSVCKQFPYQGSRCRDSVALTFEQVQAGIFSNSEKHSDVLP
jgi:hypothetical protein